MTSPVQLALMVTPLAAYLYLLAIWQAGRHPRTVAGPFDLWLLALGLGGLVLVGPLGRLVAQTLFGRMGLSQWLLMTLVAILFVIRMARRSWRRLVIYHVDGDTLDAALRDSLGPDEYVRTLSGYEDRAHACGIRVHHSPRWQTAVVEGFGHDPDALIEALRPRLRARLRLANSKPTGVSLLFFGLSALTMLVPLAGHLLTQPRTRAALRALLERLHGG
jgi:hypothetical protein